MRPLIAGNWKMHTTRIEATTLARDIARRLPSRDLPADVALFPPFLAVNAVVGAIAGTDISVGAQNFHPELKGAFTGEVSAPMLLDVGATMVLIGHSERRHVFGEQPDFLRRKVEAALAHDLVAVYCVGETLDERQAGTTAAVIETQVRAGLDGIPTDRAADIVVAYEPVWAIGTGETATPEQAGAVHEQIRALLGDIWGAPTGDNVRILYGGSVKPANAAELLAVEHIDGALVGGAALTADSFARIVQAAG